MRNLPSRSSPDHCPHAVFSRSATTLRGVRFRVARLGRIAAIGILIVLLATMADKRGPNPGDRDPNLLGKYAGWIESVAFDPSGRWLASSANDGSVYVWDMHKDELAAGLVRDTASGRRLRRAWHLRRMAQAWPRRMLMGR